MQEAAKEYKEKIPEEDSDHLAVPTIPTTTSATTTTTTVSKSPPPTNHTKRTDKCGDKCSKTERRSRERSPHRQQPGMETNQNNQANQLRSGHARTHKIVINLDDKNRFTEEVTVWCPVRLFVF